MLVNLVNKRSSSGLDDERNSSLHSPTDNISDSPTMSIELSDKCEIKKTIRTLLLDAVILANLEIICISSVGCDLRFYDASLAAKCNLRFAIGSFPSPLSALHGHCCADKNAKLILGDMVGSIRVIYLDEDFKSQLRDGTSPKQSSYHELIRVSEMDG